MTVFPDSPDESATLDLVQRLREDDLEAWNELYRRYHDQLLLVVRMRLGTGLRRWLQSEDVFQSVALDALTALKRFEYRGPGSLQRFLNTMVVNKIRDRADTFSAQKRSGAVPLSDRVAESLADPATGVPRYHDGERYDRLESGLAALPEEMREVLLARKIDGLSSKEVAAAMGRTDAAVRKLYSRALARLTTMVTGGG